MSNQVLKASVRACLEKSELSHAGNVFYLRTKENLSRSDYLQFNSILHGLGGEWVKKSNAHAFHRPLSPAHDIATIVKSGIIPKYCLNAHSFHPTPMGEVSDAIALTSLKYWKSAIKILEPSAGDGRFLREILKICPTADVSYFEIDERNQLYCSSVSSKFLGADFLSSIPTGDFDYVFMNPPFNRKEYQKHVEHAAKFLKDGGVMVAIMPSIAVQDRRFRDWMFGTMNGTSYPMDEAFENTNVKTIMVHMFNGVEEPPDDFPSYSSWLTNLVLNTDSKFKNEIKAITSTDKMTVAVQNAVDRVVRDGESLACTAEQAEWIATYFLGID